MIIVMTTVELPAFHMVNREAVNFIKPIDKT